MSLPNWAYQLQQENMLNLKSRNSINWISFRVLLTVFFFVFSRLIVSMLVQFSYKVLSDWLSDWLLSCIIWKRLLGFLVFISGSYASNKPILRKYNLECSKRCYFRDWKSMCILLRTSGRIFPIVVNVMNESFIGGTKSTTECLQSISCRYKLIFSCK